MVSVIVNLFSKQTHEGSSEMLCVYVQHCMVTPYGMAAQTVT